MNQILHIDYMHEMSKSIMSSRDSDYIAEKLRFALKFSGILNFELAYDDFLWRVRKLEGEQPFDHTSEIWYPPSKFAGVGRLNAAGSPYLYTSVTLETALLEMKAKVGDCFQVGVYKFKKGKIPRMAIVGEKSRAIKGIGNSISPAIADQMIRIARELAQKDKTLANSYRYADSFFDHIMRDPEAREKGYVHSRTLAKLTFEKHPDIDCFLYHSVASAGGQNIALPSSKADEFVGLLDTRVIRVNKVYPYGIYDIDFINRPKDIDNNGNIFWQD
ncbi:RES family NAD+ phosphorylase [Vibrio parahaemolyticus]|nr:RES family NAD+ phosphorylase [Vibrio parahaemolyticus]EKL9850443.1 RES family NAD+ phosphorylase [Vibrio parahaemolyticus]